MSYTREKRTRIKNYMMEKIFVGDPSSLREAFNELFVVFRRNNPAIELKCINENENVSRMIAHVLSD